MKISEEILEGFEVSYPIENLCTPEKMLFLDIETTGFTARSSALYMIGCAYYKDSTWRTIQWMTEKADEQTDILNAFWDFSTNFQFLVHFNGNNFDLPYLVQKSEQLGIESRIESFEGIDLYRRISPYKSFLNLPNCKQKTLELYLGLNREDIYSGGELIQIYEDYEKNPTEEAAHLLLLHNVEDIKGMLSILPLLSYHDAFNQPLKARKVQANRYRDVNDNTRMELLITVILPTPIPKPVTASASGFFAHLEGNEAMLKVPVLEGELKYFYANYKDYYYLPEEDLALHKSVASFVDKEHRTQATAQNCYTRKISSYLRQWEPVFTPFFKKDYNSHELYFEMTDELKRDRSAFAFYASHILNMISSSI